MAGERRGLLVSRVWVQAAVLVVLFGFFILGLLAYRTYMASRRSRRGWSTRGAACSTPAGTSRRASRCSCTTGSWSTARRSATARTSGPTTPPTTCAVPRISSSAPTAARARTRRGAGRSRTSAPTATTSDAARSTLTAAAGARRSAGSCRTTAASSPTRRPSTACAPDAITDPARAAPAHRVLRLDGVGGVDEPARPRLLLHEQLAARAARGQRADRQRGRLVGAVADRAAGRHRAAVRAPSGAGGAAWAGTAASRRRSASARPGTWR